MYTYYYGFRFSGLSGLVIARARTRIIISAHGDHILSTVFFFFFFLCLYNIGTDSYRYTAACCGRDYRARRSTCVVGHRRNRLCLRWPRGDRTRRFARKASRCVRIATRNSNFHHYDCTTATDDDVYNSIINDVRVTKYFTSGGTVSRPRSRRPGGVFLNNWIHRSVPWT